MTETPANTPKPIGSTSNFCPGVVAAACSAAAAEGVEIMVLNWPFDSVETDVINEVAEAETDADAPLTVPVAEAGICPGP